MARLIAGTLVVGSLSLLSCKFFPESTFELAAESRLPKWFSLPTGLTRSDVTVTMSYYIKPSGRTATFTLRGLKKETIAEATGVLKGFQPLELKNSPPGSLHGYPSYEIITVKGITEVIEHRQMEPVFYITDNLAVLIELGIFRAQ